MKRLIRMNMAFTFFLVPFLILLLIIGISGKMILDLKRSENLAIKTVCRWESLQTITQHFLTFMPISPRYGKGVSAWEGDTGISVREEQWVKDIERFEKYLGELRDNVPEYLVGRTVIGMVDNAWKVWGHTKERLEYERRLYHKIMTGPLGKDLLDLTYIKMVEGALADKRLDKDYELKDLLLLYRIQDGFTDIQASGGVVTRLMEEISFKLSSMVNDLVRGIVLISVILSLVIIGFAYFLSNKAEEILKRSRDKLELEVEDKTKALVEAQGELIRKEKLAAIGQVASTIAHEFRNQLGVIKNAAYYLKMKIHSTDEKVGKYLGVIEKEIMATNNIISNILEFSKNKKPVLQEVDLKDILEETIDKISVPEGIRIMTEIEDGLPKIKLDPVQITCVFFNICLNAFQAMGEEGELKINAFIKEGNIVAEFIDTGEGIHPHEKENIFIPFFTTKFKGTGLGLATSKTIVEAHTGTIEISGKHGEGAKVTITLPL